MNTLIIIAGPTAVGKTGVAIELAKRLDTAIVSADSRQCYQGMAIGTAQPTADELQAVKHYFINEFPVTADLNAADYERLALSYLQEIFRQRPFAVVCGGTGLYIKALCEGLDDMPAIDPAVAAAVQAGFDQYGLSWLQEELARNDPAAFGRIDVQNPARLIRALTFIQSTGQSMLAFRTGTRKERPFRIIKIGLELPRPLLYERIDRRVLQMMNEGLLQEAKALYPFRQLKNLQTVGYSELFDYLDGKHDLDTAVRLIQQHSRNYAKRQLTWFRRDHDIRWLRADDPALIDEPEKLAGITY